jgi:glyoxylase-like metal-dependent hydrolase (beta-lactamase superfamily II)
MGDAMIDRRLVTVEVSGSLVVFSLGGDSLESGFGVNCAAFRSGAGTVVVDPMVAPAHARLVDEELCRRGFPPVRWVVATHHHTDHVLGASVFTGKGARLVAHQDAAARMVADHPALIAERQRMPAVGELFEGAVVCVPDVTFTGAHAVDLGEDTVEIVALGPAHSPGNRAVVFPGEGAVCCGDLLVPGYHFNYEDADPSRVPEALRALERLTPRGITRFIPGHGAVGGVELVTDQLAYHAELAEILAASPTAAEARMALRAAAEARSAIRARWPGWRLEWVIATELARRYPPGG